MKCTYINIQKVFQNLKAIILLFLSTILLDKNLYAGVYFVKNQ